MIRNPRSAGEKAFNAGYRAVQAHKPAAANPYPESDPLRFRWRDGWQAGNSAGFWQTGWSR